jgi:hypothetical protein
MSELEISIRYSIKCPAPPRANVKKLFTAVIYCHSMVIPAFCVIKLFILGNYHGIAVNYHGIELFYNIGQVCFK